MCCGYPQSKYIEMAKVFSKARMDGARKGTRLFSDIHIENHKKLLDQWAGHIVDQWAGHQTVIVQLYSQCFLSEAITFERSVC